MVRKGSPVESGRGLQKLCCSAVSCLRSGSGDHFQLITEVVAGYESQRAPRLGAAGLSPFGGDALTPVVVPVSARVPSGHHAVANGVVRLSDRCRQRQGGGRRRALSTRASSGRQGDDGRGAHGMSAASWSAERPSPPAKRGLISRSIRGVEDQALNLVTRCQMRPDRAPASRTSTNLDALDGLDGLDGPTDQAPRPVREPTRPAFW
jgi:hypothetical protein